MKQIEQDFQRNYDKLINYINNLWLTDYQMEELIELIDIVIDKTITKTFLEIYEEK